MTNSPERPQTEGQLSVYQSPHHPDVMLVDVAEFDSYGHLTWRAIPHDSMLYEIALADYIDAA